MGLLTREDGMVQQTDQDAPQLDAAGYVRCYTNDWKKRPNAQGVKINIPCPFWISLEGQEHVKHSMGGYFTCPVCQHSYNLLHELPWHGVNHDDAQANQHADQQAHGWTSGGGTHIGLPMPEQAQLGEDLIANIGTLDRYGPITWWHPGGAAANSPLDGATQDWGIEVKTIGYDAKHHRFMPGGVRKDRDGNVLRDERADKNEQAAQMGKQGILGVLVMLDYKRSVADIYVKEMPLGVHQTPTGQKVQGVTSFRTSSGEHLIKEIPFRNPLLDPHSPVPQVQTGTSPFGDDPFLGNN